MALNRKFALVVGAQRHGKSKFCENAAIQYAKGGGTAIAYNVGKPSDFSGFTVVEMLTPERLNFLAMKSGKPTKGITPGLNLFRIVDTGEIFKVSDFKKIFKGKCVKIERVPDKKGERLFFDFVYEYLFDTMLILDDCRAIFRQGLSSEFIQIAGRVNHCGKKYAPPGNPDACGIDLLCVFHSFETVNEEIYIYINSVIQFYTINEPTINTDNIELQKIVNSAFHELKNKNKNPMYSRAEIDVLGCTGRIVKPSQHK